MKQVIAMTVFLSAIVPATAAAQPYKPGRPNANKSLETVLLSTNLTFSVINGYVLTKGDGSAWAAPLGLISGVGSLLYESGVNEGSGFVVATGFVSVAFGIVSLVKVESGGKAKRGNGSRLILNPLSGRHEDGQWYAGVRAGLRF